MPKEVHVHRDPLNSNIQTVLEVGERYLATGLPSMVFDDVLGDYWWQDCQPFFVHRQQLELVRVYGETNITTDSHPDAHAELALPHRRVLFRDLSSPEHTRELCFYIFKVVASTALSEVLNLHLEHIPRLADDDRT